MVTLEPNYPELQSNSCPTFNTLHEEHPVFRSERFNPFLITPHEDVRLAYGNREVCATAPFGTRGPATAADDRLLSGVCTPRAITAQAPMIDTFTRELLDSVQGSTSFDPRADFAGPPAVLVIADVIEGPIVDSRAVPARGLSARVHRAPRRTPCVRDSAANASRGSGRAPATDTTAAVSIGDRS